MICYIVKDNEILPWLFRMIFHHAYPCDKHLYWIESTGWYWRILKTSHWLTESIVPHSVYMGNWYSENLIILTLASMLYCKKQSRLMGIATIILSGYYFLSILCWGTLTSQSPAQINGQIAGATRVWASYSWRSEALWTRLWLKSSRCMPIGADWCMHVRSSWSLSSRR